MELLLHQILDRAVSTAPRRPALKCGAALLDYGALADSSARIAGGLLSLGVGRHDRVAVFLPNRPEAVEIALACSRAGAIFVPLNSRLKPRQVQHILRDSGARVIFTASATMEAAWEAAQRCESLRHFITVDALPSKRDDSTAHAHIHVSTVSRLHDSAPVENTPRCIDKDPAAILYTSGSTGLPKGVVLSHHNLVSGARCVTQYLRNDAEDRILAALPLSFDYGLNQVTSALYVGACAVLTNFSLPIPLLQEVVAERITGLAGVPTMWAHLAAAQWPAEAAQSLRYLTNSGGAFPLPTIAALRRQLPQTEIFCMYGLTEAFRSTYLDPAELQRRPGSIGKSIPNQEILVVRPDGSRCQPGEAGELVHRGSLVALGYWNDPERTALRFRPLPAFLGHASGTELAVWSGDLVKQDADGFLYFVGRNDQLIKTSGHRVSPTEIEQVVAEVRGVVETAVVGLPDEVLGQRIAVAVVAAADYRAALAENIRMHCRQQLPAYMVPGEIHLLDSIPRNPNGKPDRAELANLLPRTSPSGGHTSPPH